MSRDDGGLEAVHRSEPVERLLSVLEDPAASSDDFLLRGGDAEEIRDDLVRVHLPMLEAAGYIEWDREAGEIRKGPNFEEIEPLLERYME